MSWAAIGTAVGGLGLLLLGMGMLTDGLKRAAGQALHRLLGRWTRTRFRGLTTGALITAVVQSSSAVTVAIIGFANAGLLTLAQAAWIVFGSNLGTTMTGWLVALVGLKLQIEALALPLLGVGMVVRLVRPGSRLEGAGEAIAGFGALFVGLNLLKETFSGLGHALDLSGLEAWGLLGSLAGVGLGALMTALMQSSSAAMAVILTARFEGLFSPAFAAALVIGANLGTTSTALLSTIGATANARRVAVLHVSFNLLTAVAALVLVGPMLAAIAALHEITSIAATPAADLALFHTLFNLLGVVLMWPLAGFVVRILERRFRTAEEDQARPRYLDDNVLSVPELAARALVLELRRASTIALDLARDVVTSTVSRSDSFGRRARPVKRLLVAIADYATRLNRTEQSAGVAAAVTNMLRAHEHLWTLVRITGDIVSLRTDSDEARVMERLPISEDYQATIVSALAEADTARPDFDLERFRVARDHTDEARERERERLLTLSRRGDASYGAAHQSLQEVAHDRRLVNRAWKLAAVLHVTQSELDPAAAQTVEPDTGDAPEPAVQGGDRGA